MNLFLPVNSKFTINNPPATQWFNKGYHVWYTYHGTYLLLI